MVLMTKRRKGKKQVKKLPKEAGGIHFDIESDAEQLFRDFVEQEKFESFEKSEPLSTRGRKRGSQLVEEELDLHGKTVAEAEIAIDDWIRQNLKTHQRIKLKVITGKGLHSGPGGGVLVDEIYTYLKTMYREYIEKMGEDPSTLKVGGIPLRGHFDVWFKF